MGSRRIIRAGSNASSGKGAPQNPDFCGLLQHQLGALFTCTPMEHYTRIRTAFLYPDGDYIDLFARRHAGDLITLTDLGETLRWLRTHTVSPRRSVRQTQLIHDTCMNHGVELFKGQLMLRLSETEAFGEAALRLGQACLRVSDLWFTLRTRSMESVTDEVADFLGSRQIPFERGERIPGRSGRVWRPDFHTRTPSKSALVYVLSTGSRAAAKGVTEHVLASWYDLSHLRVGPSPLEFVSLFDDTADVWSGEDFELLKDLSLIARWSNQDELAQMLEAA